MEVTISIDDIHPEKGWGTEGDECIWYLDQLNKEFGAKFTLFIPSNYHNKFPISKHKDWIDWLLSKKYFELAAHGHYHMCERNDIGECEFFELDTKQKVCDRLKLMLNEWAQVNYRPIGWRNPGWLAHPIAVQHLGQTFHYAAVHYLHNHNLQWKCKMIFGADGIHETDIGLHDGKVMFQSHIAGEWNDNCWNEKNYEQMRLSLTYLRQQNIKFKTLKEI